MLLQLTRGEGGKGQRPQILRNFEEEVWSGYSPASALSKAPPGKTQNRAELENGVSPISPFLAQAAARPCDSWLADPKLGGPRTW